jgi:hypothetical protein
MAILRIKSDNPDLSYVLQKNPFSGLFLKSVKQGVMFGYFPTINGQLVTNEYVIYFKDASDEISYKKHEDESFEYLNASKYNNARFINDAIQELMHAAREKPDPRDVPFYHEISVNLVETHFKTVDIFQRYFPEVKIISEEVSKDNYRLKFETNQAMTFQRLLQIVNLFSIFASLNSHDYIYITEDLIRKYVRIANEIDAPYFIKYLIKIRMARSEKKFNSLKEELEKSNRYKIDMVHGDTHDMRIAWIRERLLTKHWKDDKNYYFTMDRPVVDIGTGIDHRYLKIFAPILQAQGMKYYAIERDYDARERIKAGLRNRNLEETVELFESIEEFLEFYNTVEERPTVDVICTEVLEHNEHCDACDIMDLVHEKINYRRFIVTVPNEDFNVHYGLTGFRHDDHKWEANVTRLMELIPNGAYFDTFKVGDQVDGIPVTYGLVLTK